LLGKLNGDKHLILGNHDKSSDHLFNYFKSISQIKEVKFRKDNFPFLKEDFDVIMCHYHMINWNRKHYGSVEVCGHSHGRLDDYNLESPDLRVDVGIDGKLANYEFISLEKLYKFFKEKAEGKLFADYAREKKDENMLI
jgi:calcineurin-like phosphoesterase family protein